MDSCKQENQKIDTCYNYKIAKTYKIIPRQCDLCDQLECALAKTNGRVRLLKDISKIY